MNEYNFVHSFRGGMNDFNLNGGNNEEDTGEILLYACFFSVVVWFMVCDGN